MPETESNHSWKIEKNYIDIKSILDICKTMRIMLDNNNESD